MIVTLLAWGRSKRKKTEELQGQFGPEYDRTLETADSKKAAEQELAARRDRREQLDIRPLSSAARERYSSQWQTVQAQFVDNPGAAVASADHLIQTVMSERGYPVQDFETRAADISVDHPQVVENYRQGHASRRRARTATARRKICGRRCVTTERSSTSSWRRRRRADDA